MRHPRPQMHEVESGLNKTVTGAANNTDPIRGAPHNLDEAWGLYAGESARCMQVQLAERARRQGSRGQH